MRIPLAREGYPFIIISVAVTLVLVIYNIRSLSLISFGLTIFVIAFFRDPERYIPEDDASIVSPADGKVIKVERCMEERFLYGEAIRISIFMNLFNVHVNRNPASGVVKGVYYNPGKFFNASMDKASLENEQNAMLIEVANRRCLLVIQIAGLIARRIVCYLKEGDTVERGKRLGIIRFGSRLDVYLPSDCITKVRIGDKVKAGSSILGTWGE